eukprot:COSAG03_NODE_166_length_11291_cov_15.762866_11_plen_82_part_00
MHCRSAYMRHATLVLAPLGCSLRDRISVATSIDAVKAHDWVYKKETCTIKLHRNWTQLYSTREGYPDCQVITSRVLLRQRV